MVSFFLVLLLQNTSTLVQPFYREKTDGILSTQEWIDPYAIIAFDFLRAQKEAFNNFTKSTFEPYQLVLLTVVTTVTILLLKRVLCHILSPEESLWKKTKRISFRLLIKLPVISSIAQKQIDKNVGSLSFFSSGS